MCLVAVGRGDPQLAEAVNYALDTVLLPGLVFSNAGSPQRQARLFSVLAWVAKALAMSGNKRSQVRFLGSSGFKKILFLVAV